MMNKIYLLLVLLFFGCESLKVQKKDPIKPTREYTKQEYEIIKQRDEFIAKINPVATQLLNKLSTKNIIYLVDLNQPLLFTIPIKDFKHIHYIEAKQKQLAIDHLLIENAEYFYNSVDQNLYLVFNLPYVYFIEDRRIFDITIVGAPKPNKTEKSPKASAINKRSMQFEFVYQPMSNPNEGRFTFDYIKMLDKNIASYIKQSIAQEKARLNTHRIPKEAMEAINAF